MDHFALIRANISALDRAVTPASEWKIRDLSIEAGNLTTRPSGPVGTLDVRAALNDSPLEFSAQDIDLTPTSFAGQVLDPELQPAPGPALPAADARHARLRRSRE